jgi:ABC-type transport system substrate-binding protein
MRFVFHSENVGTGWNFSHLKNPEIDTLLEESDIETDPQKRGELFSQIQMKIMEVAAIYPLWPQNRVWGYHKYVKGFAVHPGGEVFVAYDVSLDK